MFQVKDKWVQILYLYENETNIVGKNIIEDLK